jgi:hypothetical protein
LLNFIAISRRHDELTVRFLSSFSLRSGTHAKAVRLSAREQLPSDRTAGLIALVDLLVPLRLLLVHESAILRWVVTADVHWLPGEMGTTLIITVTDLE